jgi:hypothetical protein
MVDGRLLNNFIPVQNTLFLISSEVTIQHMQVIFMSCVYNVYVWICLKLFYVVHNNWQ